MFKDVLQKLRNSRNLSQSDFGEALDISQATVASWENGTRKPDIYMLVKIADYFDVTTDELLDRKQDDNMTEEEREIWELREKVRRDPARRYMFSFAKDGDLKSIQRAVAVVDALRGVDE